MKIEVKPGKYVLAVSGGVDSMVLLDLLRYAPGVELVMAHMNHGIRAGAADDEAFVRAKAEYYGLPIEVGRAFLGSNASEEQARDKRYQFLEQVKQKYEAQAIITGHHQDDLIETAIINILRGSGPRGMVAMSLNEKLLRPLLNVPKAQIIEYAQQKGLAWVEDESNLDLDYLRNYVRHIILSKLTSVQRQQILEGHRRILKAQRQSQSLIDDIAERVFIDELTINRQAFIFLPTDVGAEVITDWLRRNGLPYDRSLIGRLVVAVKTAKANSRHDVSQGAVLEMSLTTAHLSNRVRSA